MLGRLPEPAYSLEWHFIDAKHTYRYGTSAATVEFVDAIIPVVTVAAEGPDGNRRAAP